MGKDRVKFGTWMLVVLSGHTIGAAIFLGLAGLVLSMSVRMLLVPFAMFSYCGLVLAPFLYWARLARESPRVCARRFATAIFFYLQVVMLALGFSAVKLGILSQHTALNDYGPFMLPFSALASACSYYAARQILQTPKRVSN